jgi:hypothetical protein
MNELREAAPAFVEMAHRIVWCSAATVDVRGRPRSRVLHPFWEWDGSRIVGWVATRPTPLKSAHLRTNPYVSINYWSPSHDTCAAECRAALMFDHETRSKIWNTFLTAPQPVGYDPAIVPGWENPASETFAVLRLEPWRLRVFPGTVLTGKGGAILTWRE